MAKKSKKELESAKELAQLLYMEFVLNSEIASRVGVSAQTVTAWVKENNWKEKRAAKTITRTQLINSCLLQINKILEKEDAVTASEADKVAKLSSLIEKLDKKNSPVISMEVFTQFSKFINAQASFDRAITMEFMKMVNRYQDEYITSLMNG